MSVGRLADAIAESDRALLLDPFSIPINTMRTFILTNLRQYDRALDQGRRFAELSPQAPVPHVLLARIYWIQGRVPEAIAESKKVAALVQSAQLMGDQDEVAAAFDKGGVRAAALKAAQLMERDGDFMWASFEYGIALNAPKVLECWEQALREGDGNVVNDIKIAPEFDFTHSDPGYQEMLHRLNLAE
jgi:tetratricopeptide (TPR) repeat protein